MSSFDEQRDGVNTIAAIVLRRGAKPEAPGPRMTFVGMLYFIFCMKLSKRFGLQPDGPYPFEPLPDGYNSGTGRGDGRILFSAEFRHVLYRDATYPLTDDGSTRVVLIDERGPGVDVVLRSAVIPPFDRPQFRQGMDKRAFAKIMADAHRRQHVLTNEALRADPVIREFMQ